MDVGRRLFAIDEGDDVGMVEAFKDGNLRRQIVLELLVELSQVDGLDCDEGLLVVLALWSCRGLV